MAAGKVFYVGKRSSLKLALMSFVAAVLVVCIHTPFTPVRGLSQLFEGFIGLHLAAVAVPFFFIASGFFLGRHTDEHGWYGAALGKRVKTLLIPYLIWCVVLCVMKNVYLFAANVIHCRPLMSYFDCHPIDVFGLNPNVNPPQPLWYLRALMFYVLISPAFVLVARNKFILTFSIVGLFVLGCFHGAIVSTFPGDLFLFVLAPLNVLCFLSGIFLGRNPHLIEKSSPRGGGIVMAVAIGLMAFNAICEYVPFELGSVLTKFLRQTAVLLVIAGAWHICPTVELPSIFKAQSFPVYLLHGVFLPFPVACIAVMKMRLLHSFIESAAGYVFIVAFAVACSIVASHVLRRFLPRFNNVIFGGR